MHHTDGADTEGSLAGNHDQIAHGESPTAPVERESKRQTRFNERESRSGSATVQRD